MTVHRLFTLQIILIDLALALHEFDDAIIFCSFVRDRLSALGAHMHDHPTLLAVLFHMIRAHQILTR